MPRESTTHLIYITLLIAVLVAAWLLWPKPQSMKVLSVVTDSVMTLERLPLPISIAKVLIVPRVVRVPVAESDKRGDTTIYRYETAGEAENDSVRVEVEHKFSINDKTMQVERSTMKIDAMLKAMQVKTITNNSTVMREDGFLDKLSIDAGLGFTGGTLRPYVGASYQVSERWLFVPPVRLGFHLSN